MLIKRTHLEAWHISDDGKISYCGIPIKQTIEIVREHEKAYGNYVCKICERLLSERESAESAVSDRQYENTNLEQEGLSGKPVQPVRIQ